MTPAKLIILGSLACVTLGAFLSGSMRKSIQPDQRQPLVRAVISDGCDLAGAIPDCKEEMAKLALQLAAHPLPPRPATPAKFAGSHSTSSVLDSAIEAAQNEAKADEARAAMKAHELQRKMNEANDDFERSKENLAQTIEQSNARMKAADNDYRNAKYGMEIEERRRAAIRRGY
jgi:hypothetical protein